VFDLGGGGGGEGGEGGVGGGGGGGDGVFGPGSVFSWKLPGSLLDFTPPPGPQLSPTPPVS